MARKKPTGDDPWAWSGLDMIMRVEEEIDYGMETLRDPHADESSKNDLREWLAGFSWAMAIYRDYRDPDAALIRIKAEAVDRYNRRHPATEDEGEEPEPADA